MILRNVYRALALVCFVSLLSSCMSSFLVNYGLSPKNNGKNYAKERAKMERRVPGITHWIDSLTQAGVLRDTFLVRDGFRLHANYAFAPEVSAKTALIVHGYSVNNTNVMFFARMYRDVFGFNVLLPDLRNHGLSEGEYVQMGWGDRLDLLAWSELAHNLFNDDTQVLHGMSMGAATVMMASGENTPDYVKGFVEDCGFTSVEDEISYILKKKLLLKPDKIVENADRLCQERFGWSIYDASSVKQLKKCDKPMLFIHGGADKLVPPFMAWECYDAKETGIKEIWIGEGSGHSRTYPEHVQEYTERVRDFLDKYIKGR